MTACMRRQHCRDRKRSLSLRGSPSTRCVRRHEMTYDPGFGPLVETTMRVATWNLWGRYGPWEARQPIIEDNLRSIDADVVCLQEAWDDEHVSQPEKLADALGMSFVYERAFEMNGAWSGNAVLSRWP